MSLDAWPCQLDAWPYQAIHVMLGSSDAVHVYRLHVRTCNALNNCIPFRNTKLGKSHGISHKECQYMSADTTMCAKFCVVREDYMYCVLKNLKQPFFCWQVVVSYECPKRGRKRCVNWPLSSCSAAPPFFVMVNHLLACQHVAAIFS